MTDAANGFTAAERERARAFHRPRHRALLGGLALTAAALGALTRLRLGLPWWAAALLTPALVEVVVALVRLPLGAWRYRHDRRYGLSTQAPGAFAVDTAKSLGVGAVLSTAALAPLFALAHAWPVWWPLPAAIGAAALVLVLGFVAPVLLEPVFNRFSPLGDPELAGRLERLAERAGAPVRAVLVADASRRTTARNAYVSGLGRTRRVVVWDTLLGDPADEIALVVAHELGHRVRRHVAWLTAAGMAGTALFVLLLRLVVPHPVPHDTALILLLGFACELAALPAASALSRRFEREADRFSLALTGDRDAFRAVHRRLALGNLAELEPPRWLYAWFFSHPTPPQRLRSADPMS